MKKEDLIKNLEKYLKNLDVYKLYNSPDHKDTKDWLANVTALLQRGGRYSYKRFKDLSQDIYPSVPYETRKRAAEQIDVYIRQIVAQYKGELKDSKNNNISKSPINNQQTQEKPTILQVSGHNNIFTNTTITGNSINDKLNDKIKTNWFQKPEVIIGIITILIGLISIPWWPIIFNKTNISNHPTTEIGQIYNQYIAVVFSKSAYTIKGKEVNISYPQIKSGLNTEQISKFNEFIELFAKNIYEEQKVVYPTNWQGETIIERADDNIISGRISILINSKNLAHPNTFTRTFNYYLKENKNLTLSELFILDSKYLETISEISKNQMVDSYKQNETTEIPMEMIIRGTSPELNNYKNFIIGSDYILFIFDPYTVGPYVEGEKEVKIGYTAISKYVNPDISIFN